MEGGKTRIYKQNPSRLIRFPDFFGITDSSGLTPLSRIWDNGIINNGQKPTVSDLEQQVKNEQSISLMDLDEAVQREKKPSVLKKLKEQPPQSANERKPRKTNEKEI